ncbi:hypothetical protein MSAN_01757300 [Mycena sanguinolenta]|uniref:Uncharacterized protein n=1 Tax=Mycena sanguinolenta TaxID=230812 RepID=A0A8H6XX80_9AGAR|nr:hypothetical protein MSAN_01757300 [Mycena sanguinolenta]
MPSFTQNVDVNSPLLTYTGPWKVGGADGDTEADKYNLGTFVICGDPSCSATLAFTGTEVHVVGAYRLNSCPYIIKLDGQTLGTFGTATVTVEQFQIDLFNKTNLAAGAHSLTISPNITGINQSIPDLNLDYFTWTTEVNSLTDLHLQDDTQSFVYTPSSAWTAFDDDNLPGFPDFDEGTGHVTAQNGATALFSFAGDRVALYGAIGAQGGPYNVQIDGGTPSSFTAKQNIFDPNTALPNYLSSQLLFYASNLGMGNHSITVTAIDLSAGESVSIDYAIVDGTLNSVPGPITSSTPTSPSSTPSTSTFQASKHGLSPGQLGGIAAGATLGALCLLALLAYYLLKATTNQLADVKLSNIQLSIIQHLSPNAAGAQRSSEKGSLRKTEIGETI